MYTRNWTTFFHTCSIQEERSYWKFSNTSIPCLSCFVSFFFLSFFPQFLCLFFCDLPWTHVGKLRVYTVFRKCENKLGTYVPFATLLYVNTSEGTRHFGLHHCHMHFPTTHGTLKLWSVFWGLERGRRNHKNKVSLQEIALTRSAVTGNEV
jgi:hypothetical protein